MKKWMKIVLIILGIWAVIFLIDFTCVKTINKPIFMINVSKDDNIGEYYGLLYKVIKCDDTIKMGTYSLKYTCTIEEDDKDNVTILDSHKFSSEYTSVDNDNVFVYRNISEIISILDNGTGIVYLGFPECKWCQAYVPYLNEVAKENNLDKIYCFNILEDRKNNTEEYMEIVNLLKFYLRYDEEGVKRVYVPAIIAVKEGVIVGFDDETSYDTKGFSEPSEYWNSEAVSNLKSKLDTMIKEVNVKSCTECNEDK